MLKIKVIKYWKYQIALVIICFCYNLYNNYFTLIMFIWDLIEIKHKQYLGIMESNSVPFYEKFAVLSVILPYYDYTHRCFLLLSELWNGSRETLTQWYEEFVNAMRPYWETFYLGHSLEGELPPWDLYNIDFSNRLWWILIELKYNII